VGEKELDLCLDAAGAGETPTAQGFVNRKQAGDHKNQSQPQIVIHQHNAGDEAERADDTARDATVALDVRAEEIAHGGNLAQDFHEASRSNFESIANG
jgi:hypothetical protein